MMASKTTKQLVEEKIYFFITVKERVKNANKTYLMIKNF